MSNSKDISDSINKWALKECQTIYDRLFDGFVNKTPVDTGNARSGWEKTSPIDALGQVGVIENNVPYIGWLEYGTDDTDPHYMVTYTILEVKRDYR